MGREDVLRLIAGKLANVATSRNRPHTLLVGPRGAGKTHLLEVALHRARRDVPAFDQHVVVVCLDEDLVGVPRLIDLQREILRHLGAARPDPGVYMPDVIAAALGDRVLLLVVENLDRLFASLREAGQQDFRGWVETSRQIMVLASAPLLFPGISDRSLPWWGSFTVVHLDELTLHEGRALLVHRAEEDGDDALVAFLRSDRGLARLRAVDALTGGSPRIWMILADVITVELLDELVPAVEALLEGLVPYYQQLLWDLSPVEQLAVRALAEGSRQAMTVSELAAATDTDQRSLSTTLGRLVESRWLRAEKPDGLDKRLTFYRLREPMLRHHLHYRAGDDQPLPVIIEMLRAWFDRDERSRHLNDAVGGSERERMLAFTFSDEPHTSDTSHVDHDLDELLANARSWIHGSDEASRTPRAGELIEQCVLLGRDGLLAAERVAAERAISVPASLLDLTQSMGDDAMPVQRVRALLDAAADTSEGRTHAVLELVAACWNADKVGPGRTRDRLSALLATISMDDQLDALILDVQDEHAYYTGMVGDLVLSQRLLVPTLANRHRLQGRDHPDTFTTRHNIASLTVATGHYTLALAQFETVLADQTRVLGPNHLHTLNSRHGLAYVTGQAGNPAAARDQYAALLSDRTRILGPDHPHTLSTRHGLAYATGRAGDPAAAAEQHAALLLDRTRVLGPDHPDTLNTRRCLAFSTYKVGDYIAARGLLADLACDQERLLGADHVDTLLTRHNLASCAGASGDVLEAHQLLRRVAASFWRLGMYDRFVGEEVAAAEWAIIGGRPGQALADLVSVKASLSASNPSVDRALARAAVMFLSEERHREHPAEQRIRAVDEPSLLTDLRCAVQGDAAARARLPGELLTMVNSARNHADVEEHVRPRHS